MKKIALVSARDVGPLDEDMEPLRAAVRAEGAEADVVLWDDPAADWGAYALAVVRSTWNYVGRRDEFLAWAERVERLTALANPASVLRWNTDKHYLRELAAAGVPTVPTAVLEPSDPVRLPFPGELVVKPAIGAGSMDAARYSAGDRVAAEAHVRRLQAAGRSVLVQPYLGRVDQAGETALVYIAGEYSHAIRKGPMLRPDSRVVGGLFLEEEIRAREATPAERAVAEGALRAAPKPLLYARVDVIPGPEGNPLILEFEATEPSLFFRHSDGAAGRLARAALARC